MPLLLNHKLLMKERDATWLPSALLEPRTLSHPQHVELDQVEDPSEKSELYLLTWESYSVILSRGVMWSEYCSRKFDILAEKLIETGSD